MCRYQQKTGPLINNLHPVSVWIYTGTLFLLAMSYSHPLYLLMLLAAVLMAIRASGALREWKGYLLFAFGIASLIVLINAFVSSAGSTIILKGPKLPVFGQIFVTKEAAAYGLSMGLKILLTISIFCLYQAIIDIDEALSFALRITPKSAVVIITAFLMIPRIKRNLSRISQVMSARGANFDAKGAAAKIKAHSPLWNVLLLSSLEGSWDSAEALYMKGFGTGKRTFYQRRSWMGRDSMITAGCIFSLMGFVFSLFSGSGFYKFYPLMGSLFTKKDFWLILWLFSGLSTAVILHWSWHKWKFLRLRT